MYNPKYTITNSILRSVGKIEAAKEVVDNALLVPAWERRFREEAKVRTVHYGTHLEGNSLSYSEAERVMMGQEVTGKKRDVQEVINYREVMDYIDKMENLATEGSVVMSEEMFKEVHRLTVEKLLPDNEAGEYRKVKVVIRNTTTGEITFRPPPPVEIPFLMDGFYRWLNSAEGKKAHPIIRAGLLHYELARVHPFTDGNGRAARAMAMLLLFIEGYKVKKFFSLDEYYDSNPADYYDALKGVEKSGDLTGWLEYFALGIAIELNRVKELVQKLAVDLKLKAAGGKQIALSERQIRLIEFLEKSGTMTMGDAKEVLPMVSEDTILRDLRDLIKKGVIMRKGKTKGVKYFMKQGE